VPKEITHFGKRLVAVDEGDTGTLTLHFKNNTTAQADCVVGADGYVALVRRTGQPC